MEHAQTKREGSCGCSGPNSTGLAHCCCEQAFLVHVLGRKYAMPVVNRTGRRQGARFSDLQQTLGVSSSTLADTLQELERAGLILRVVVPDSPPGSRYFLTAAGRTLRQRFRPFLVALQRAE